ncbi:MAG: hypothetical protein ACFFBD_27855 [Candidatus Hodarchaeota archaeon]
MSITIQEIGSSGERLFIDPTGEEGKGKSGKDINMSASSLNPLFWII